MDGYPNGPISIVRDRSFCSADKQRFCSCHVRNDQAPSVKEAEFLLCYCCCCCCCFFLRLLNVDLVSVLKLNKRNLVKFQPSWPHAWSTTHAYPFLGDYKNNGAARRKRFKKRAVRGTRISFCGHGQIHSSPLSKTTPVLKRNHLRKP